MKDGRPLAIPFGHGNIIPGPEKAMDGREAGDSFCHGAAAEAYGERRDGLNQRIPKKHFGAPAAGAGHYEDGAHQLRPARGHHRSVGMSVVDVDLNHPMAGRRPMDDIVDVREATPEELEHHHVHGDGGHAH